MGLPKTIVSKIIQKGPEQIEQGQKSNLQSGFCKTTAADDKFLEEAAIIAHF